MKKLDSGSRDKPTLSQNKSNLARLMATENISVRHRPIKTAKFDLKNRVLHCPVWQEMDGNIYDLLMGHEISHALNTPLLGWHDTITNDAKDKSRPKIKSFLNVVEDARIEKIIKRKYPGLRRPFAEAYKSLHERDFFGVSRLKGDYSSLRLIDRINLFFKVGAHLHISFDKEEKVFVDRAENIETFEEAAQLARDIYDYAKFKEPEKTKNKNDNKGEKDKSKKDKSEKSKEKSKDKFKDEGDDDSEDGDSEDNESGDSDDSDENDSGSGDGTDESDDSDGDSEDGEGESESDDESEENDNQKPGGKNAGKNEDEINEEPTSETDDFFREQEKDLVNEHGEGILYLDIPKANLKTIIVPHKMVVGKYETSIVAQFQNSNPRGLTNVKAPMNYSEVSSGLNAAFHKRNKGFIGMLVKEFEMRKNANQYARQLTAKTGELDDKKLSRYKLTMDVFRKVTTITKGKSHGMIMFLDFSGSMSMLVREILEQVLILCTFCRRIGIPFDVYGFGDIHSYNFGVNSKMMFTPVNGGFTFGDSHFNLRHLISSSLSGNAYKKAFTMLNVIAQISNHRDRDPQSSACFNEPTYQGNITACGFELGGTPFNETLVASKYIIDEFKNKHHVDITNVIYLSDGDGYGDIRNGENYSSVPYDELTKTRIGVRDFNSKIGVLTDNKNILSYQTALTRLVAETTNCRHIGYYFATYSHIRQRLIGNVDLKKNITEHSKFLDANGYISVPNLGYDNYYYVNTETMTYRGDMGYYPGYSAADMGKNFIDHQKRKMNSKMIIKEFAADIAE
jgi:hypothetical protein